MSSDREWPSPLGPVPGASGTAGSVPAGLSGPAPTGLPRAEPDGSPFDPPRRPLRKRITGALAVVAVVLAKFKAILLLLPKVKLLATSGSALVSIAAYSFVFGWPFAVGFVALLFVHEMGHVFELRRQGIRATAPMFIPFLGAYIGAKSLGDNALTEAKVGLAGPILGSLAAGAVAVLGAVEHSSFLLALGYTGLFLNLFNLVPVSPLDGGRAMAAMAPVMWVIGLLMLVAFAIIFPNPIIILFILLGFFDVRRRLRARREGGAEQEAYYRVRPRDRLLVGAVYLGLVAVLALGMHAAYVARTF